MATIRCMDVADSPQFVVERSFAIVAEGAGFVASLFELFRKAKPPFWEIFKSSGEGALNSECSFSLQNDQYALAAPPGMTRSFFLCRSKRSGLLRTKENDKTMRVWLLCWRVRRVDRRLKDDSLCSLSLHGSEGRSSKVLVADASSARVASSATIRIVSADETDVKWWCRWVAQRERSLCSVMLLV